MLLDLASAGPGGEGAGSRPDGGRAGGRIGFISVGPMSPRSDRKVTLWTLGCVHEAARAGARLRAGRLACVTPWHPMAQRPLSAEAQGSSPLCRPGGLSAPSRTQLRILFTFFSGRYLAFSGLPASTKRAEATSCDRLVVGDLGRGPRLGCASCPEGFGSVLAETHSLWAPVWPQGELSSSGLGCLSCEWLSPTSQCQFLVGGKSP